MRSVRDSDAACLPAKAMPVHMKKISHGALRPETKKQGSDCPPVLPVTVLSCRSGLHSDIQQAVFQ